MLEDVLIANGYFAYFVNCMSFFDMHVKVRMARLVVFAQLCILEIRCVLYAIVEFPK